MLLVIDVGNTNIVCAVYEGGQLLGKWRTEMHVHGTVSTFGEWLLPLLHKARLGTERIKGAVIGSGVKEVTPALAEFCATQFQVTPLVVTATMELGVVNAAAEPEKVGVDRLANASAAWAKYQTACLVIDMGTATTFDVVDQQGRFIGGVIAPGVQLFHGALTQVVPHLPRVDIAVPQKAIGADTVSALQAGTYFGYVGLLKEITERMKREFAAPLKVIATGGFSEVFKGDSSFVEVFEPDLTLWGLAQIHARQLAVRVI